MIDVSGRPEDDMERLAHHSGLPPTCPLWGIELLWGNRGVPPSPCVVYFLKVSACPNCSRPLEGAGATVCPHCGKSLSGAAPASAPSGQMTAVNADVGKSEKVQRSGARFVSSAGPSLPVRKHPQDDSVPAGSSWMQRLEAVRQTGLLENLDRPPPKADRGKELPVTGASDNGNKDDSQSFRAKPAHLLVAELEEADRKRQEEKKAPKDSALGEGKGTNRISQVKIAKPEAKTEHRKIPTALLISVVVVVMAGGSWIGYWQVSETDSKELENSAQLVELKKNIERRKNAVASMEKGHISLAAGKVDAALTAYRKALDLEPSLGKAHKGLGAVFAKKKNVPKMLEHYKKYLQLEPAAKDAVDVKKIIAKHEIDPSTLR